MSEFSAPDVGTVHWQGLRVAVVGRLAGASKREARRLLKARGAVPVDDWSTGVDLVIVGEHDLAPLDLAERIEQASPDEREAARMMSETDLWRELGDAAAERPVHRLYTPTMLAGLLNVSPSVIRRWHRRGLIRPTHEVRKLPYFDFQEVSTARRLAELLSAGASPTTIERQLSALRRMLPGVERPLAQLSIIVAGRELLLRQGDGLVDPGGQYRLDFEARGDDDGPASLALPVEADEDPGEPTDAAAAARAAARCEDRGQLSDAADLYRAALAMGGPHSEYCFQLADVLYRLGDVGAARERYFAAIELDEDYVEARANLGCILAEEGRFDLAIAAFEGALKYHDDYPDVHYHLARVLDEAGRTAQAETHWRRFLEIVPESPWAENARRRLGVRDDENPDADAEKPR